MSGADIGTTRDDAGRVINAEPNPFEKLKAPCADERRRELLASLESSLRQFYYDRVSLPLSFVSPLTPNNEGGLFKVVPHDEWNFCSTFPPAGHSDPSSHTPSEQILDMGVALGGILAVFPASSDLAQRAADSLSQFDSTLGPLISRVVISQTQEDFPEEQIVPILAKTVTAESTDMLEKIARTCNLPHVRVDALVAIARRDLERAQQLAADIQGNLDLGTVQWIAEELDQVRSSSLPILQAASAQGNPLSLFVDPDQQEKFRKVVLGSALLAMPGPLDLGRLCQWFDAGILAKFLESLPVADQQQSSSRGSLFFQAVRDEEGDVFLRTVPSI